jgi:Protein of unknown function (DUF2515)
LGVDAVHNGSGVSDLATDYDSQVRHLNVARATITLDGDGTYEAGASFTGTVSIVDPRPNADYVVRVDFPELGKPSQYLQGTTVDFSVPLDQLPAGGLGSVQARIFWGPNAMADAQGARADGQSIASAACYVYAAGNGPSPYVAQAWGMLNDELLNANSGDAISRNQMITRLYAEMYDGRDFQNRLNSVWAKWAGMAAFASRGVGAAMGLSGGAEGAKEAPIVGGLIRKANVDAKSLLNLLQRGNFLVYMDVYPQFLAYQRGGLAEVQTIPTVQPLQITGWGRIEQGLQQNDQQMVWSGNTDLLQFEQKTTLQQGVYQGSEALFAQVSPAAPSPMPGNGPSFAAMITPLLQPGWLFGGQTLNLANVDQRWVWVVDEHEGQLHYFSTWAVANAFVNINDLLRGVAF